MWNTYAATKNADGDGEPRCRRQKHVDEALRLLRSAAIADAPVEMACEVQVATSATVSVRAPPFSDCIFSTRDCVYARSAPFKDPLAFLFYVRLCIWCAAKGHARQAPRVSPRICAIRHNLYHRARTSFCGVAQSRNRTPGDGKADA